MEWSDADGAFVGRCPGVIGPCCHGPNEVGGYRELCGIVEEWLEATRRDGKPLPLPTAAGSFLRTARSLNLQGPPDWAERVGEPPSPVNPRTGMPPVRTIRAARRDDLDALVEVGRRSWLSAFAQAAPFELIAWWARTDRTRTLYEEHWPGMLVLEEAGEVVGLVQPAGDEVNGLWVRPDRQGTGAGSLLLAAAEEAIRAAGHETAWLTCSGWNPRALQFYAARGYVETGRERSVGPAGVEVEDVRMERRLGEPVKATG